MGLTHATRIKILEGKVNSMLSSIAIIKETIKKQDDIEISGTINLTNEDKESIILDSISSVTGYSVGFIKAGGKGGDISMARHLAFYLLRDIIKYSYPIIARIMGNINHTTVISGYKKVEDCFLVNDEKNLILRDLHKKSKIIIDARINSNNK